MTTTSTRGAVLLPIALLLFLVSLTGAAYISFRLWQTNQLPPAITVWLPADQPTPASPSPSPDNDILLPQLSIDPTLAEHEAAIDTKLFVPLRQYYATQPGQLGDVSVTSAEGDHSTRVTFEITQNGAPETVSFFYGTENEEGSITFPDWTPSLLDETAD